VAVGTTPAASDNNRQADRDQDKNFWRSWSFIEKIDEEPITVAERLPCPGACPTLPFVTR
jgi:hypothetical protein